MNRSLSLKKEALAELSPAVLASVAGAAASRVCSVWIECLITRSCHTEPNCHTLECG